MEELIFWLALVLFSLASQVLRRKPQASRPVPRPRETRAPVLSEGRVVSRRAPAPGSPEPSPRVPLPGTRAPAAATPPAPSRPAPLSPVLDGAVLARAVILSEILGKPRGLRPWRPQGWRR